MIERLYIKDYLSFEEAELEFRKGLVVFTGPSGAGKSILIKALLALFGLHTSEARLAEALLDMDIDLEKYGILPQEEITIRAIKKEKMRYFINNQTISKKMLAQVFKPVVSYLHQKDTSFFSSENVLNMVESFIQESDYAQLKNRYVHLYNEYQKSKKALEEIYEKEKREEDLKEFLRFEIEKIESIAPKPGEYEELLAIKKALSKKEKVAQTLQEAMGIFEYEGAVAKALELIEQDDAFFTQSMNELRDLFSHHAQRLEELEEIDIEEVLNRVEQLSSLKRRYGSVEEAIEVLQRKREELRKIEHIAFEKEELEKRVKNLYESLQEVASQITAFRKEGAKALERGINEMVHSLKLPQVAVKIEEIDLGPKGKDSASVLLDGVDFAKVSSGEYNRLRLAFMSVYSQKKGGEGIVILDEIDANISGEESMAVAKVLKKLSRHYQIFAISHQAQLASMADQHFLVTKEKKSEVKELRSDQRVREIARIISGENITNEAVEFAKKMLKDAK